MTNAGWRGLGANVAKNKGSLQHLAIVGTDICVRVTPKASRNEVTEKDGVIRVYVTAVPEDGKATKAVAKLLAEALGLPKSRLTLVQGQTSREKRFRLS